MSRRQAPRLDKTIGGLSSTFAALVHASRHATGGADAIFPEDIGAEASSNRLTTGEGTMGRGEIISASVSSATGILRLAYFTARKTETITQMRITSGSTAATATPTLVRAGIYTVDGSGNLTLAASIANDTALFAAANTVYTRSLSGGNLSKVRGQRYAVGTLVVSGAATPTFLGSAIAHATEMAAAPRLVGQVSGQSDLPASIAVGSVADAANRIYSVLLP